MLFVSSSIKTSGFYRMKTIFPFLALIVCVLFADKMFMWTHSREHAGLTKSILEANLFRCIFSIWFVYLPQTNSMNTYTPLRNASGFHPNLFYSSWRAIFTPSFLVLIWAIPAVLFLSPACIHTSSYMCLLNLFPFLQPVSLILTLPG